SIGAQCQDLSPQFPVAGQDLFCRIGVAETIFKTGSVTFQADLLLNKSFQDLVQNILIFFVRIILVLLRTVPHYIINMSAGIKTGKCVQIFQKYFKITMISLILGSSLEKDLVIGIHVIGHMGGTNDEVKRSRGGNPGELPGQMRLKPQFQSEKDLYAVLIGFFQLQKLFLIGIDIQIKGTISSGKIRVQMFSKAHGGKSQPDSLLYHFLHGSIAVPGKRGMKVIVTIHRSNSFTVDILLNVSIIR